MDFAYETAPITEIRIGLIVLQADETLERDLRQLIPPETNLLVSRIPSGAEVTEETLGRMATDLPAATKLLPQKQNYAAIGYGCTSGAAVIGPAQVAALIRAAAPVTQVTDPVTALLAACTAMKILRLGILSPYVADVSVHLRKVLAQNDISTPVFGSFNEAAEDKVVRIAPASILAAAETLAASGGIDALFLSCTNLRTLELIAPLEARLGLPVLSSNQVIGWHLMRLAGLAHQSSGFGQLFKEF